MPVFVVRFGNAAVRVLALLVVLLVTVAVMPLLAIAWPWLPRKRVLAVLILLRGWTREIVDSSDPPGPDAQLPPETSESDLIEQAALDIEGAEFGCGRPSPEITPSALEQRGDL